MPATATPPAPAKSTPPAPAAPAPAAAPAAPPPKPAAAPAKPAAPVVPSERDPADWMGEAAADLDALSEAGDAAAEGRKPGEKRADKPPVKPPVEPPKVDDEPPKPAEGEGAPPPAEPTKLNDLRSAYSTLKKKVKEEYEPKVQRLETRVKELEGANPPEVKALQQRLEAAEKRRDELESEIVFVNFSKSDKFIKEYQTPYHQAWQAALSDLKELTVDLADGSTRPASQDDMVELANMPLGRARIRARELFGDNADDVMIHRRKILDLSQAQEKALEDARTHGLENARLQQAEQKTTAERRNQLWNQSNETIGTKWPKMFRPVEGDEEGNTLLTKGTALADRAFAPTPETAPKSDEERVFLHAMIRNKAANHDRVALWLKRATNKIKELEKTISEYEASGPNGGLDGRGAPGAGKAGNYLEDADAELDALDKRGS